jgi:hypothetical protein
VRPIPVRQLSPDPLAQVLKLLTQAHGRRSGVLEGPRGHGQAAEIILEARLGSGQVCVGAGRLPAEHDRHQQRLMPGGHRLIPDPDDVAFGEEATKDLLGPGAVILPGDSFITGRPP